MSRQQIFQTGFVVCLMVGSNLTALMIHSYFEKDHVVSAAPIPSPSVQGRTFHCSATSLKQPHYDALQDPIESGLDFQGCSEGNFSVVIRPLR